MHSRAWMEKMAAAYYVVLDSNVWISELLLQSSLGSAFLYAIAGAGAKLGLPEIVEQETTRTIEKQCEDAVVAISKSVRLLRQISEHRTVYTAPTLNALRSGIAKRWKSLDGLLVRCPFTFDIASAALRRIFQDAPPSARNNEQFTDCCVWETVLSLATAGPAHFVTADLAFFENRDRNKGLAKALRAELTSRNLAVQLHYQLADFMAAVSASHAILREEEIGAAIEQAVRPIAIEKTARSGRAVALTLAATPTIRGYATPKPSMVAVSFRVDYDVIETPGRHKSDQGDRSEFSLEGTCAYDPNSGTVTDVFVREWTSSIPGGRGSITTYHAQQFEELVAAGQFRVVG